MLDEVTQDQGELAQIGQMLREAIGADKVKDDELARVTYSMDVSAAPARKPAFVVLPEETADVVAILKIANEHKIPVGVMAGGVNATGAALPSEGGIALDLKRMNKIHEINTDSGYAVIDPGVDQNHLSAALREKGYRMHITTAPPGATPLGGSLQRPSGSLSTRHLDHVVDMEVVLADGTVFNTGSSLFPDAGPHLRYGPFPDLAGLFMCAYGTLGVITKASMRIYPINEANRVHVAGFDEFSDAVDYMKDLINNNIPEHCIIWNWQVLKAFEVGPKDREFHIPDDVRLNPRSAPDGIPYSIVTSFLSGYEETMQAYEGVLEKVAQKFNGRAITEEEMAEIFPAALPGWTELYAKYRAIQPTFFGLGRYMAWITFSEPEDVKKLEKWAVDQLSNLEIPPVCYYAQPFDFGRSIFFRIFCFPDPEDQEKVDEVLETYDDMLSAAMKNYGAVPMRVKYGRPAMSEVGEFGKVLTDLKKTLDPNNILNRGIGMFEDLDT